jgi:hypothetical protein
MLMVAGNNMNAAFGKRLLKGVAPGDSLERVNMT